MHAEMPGGTRQGVVDSRHIETELEFLEDIAVRPEALAQLEAEIVRSPFDTRAPLPTYVSNADAYQSRVIESTDSTIRVLAPAGSGKTQTVVNRVLSRIFNKGVRPGRILVLTFDNAAANAIRLRLAQFLEESDISLTEEPVVNTLNAFGYSILRSYFRAEYRDVIPDYRQRRVVRELKAALRQKSPERFALLPGNVADSFYLELFSLFKNELFDPRQPDAQKLADLILSRTQLTLLPSLQPDVVKKVIQAVIWLYMAYERVLLRERLLDFDDQKLRPYVCLQDEPMLLAAIQRTLDEVIVDEFQDINRLDFELIRAIAGKATLVVFGDDDQAIYGFRGCTPDFIIDLDTYLERSATSHELSINYRCPPNLVEHAGQLISHNTRRVPKFPIAHSTRPAEIRVVSSVSAMVEAALVVAFIHGVKRAKPDLPWSQVAVLYRTNAQSLPLQVQFVLNGIPYFVRREDNLLGNDILERLLGVLRLKLAMNADLPPDPADAMRTTRAYFPFVSRDNFLQLQELFRSQAWFLQAIQSEAFCSILSDSDSSRLLSAVRRVLNARSLKDTLDVLARDFRGLRGMIGSLEDVLNQRVPLGEIYEVAQHFGGNMAQFVQTMERALDQAKATNAGNAKDNGVGLLTYFKAKGRQWDSVILTTCNEGIIPHSRAPIEDERRLFYVAMTRATSNLLISYLKDACNNRVNPSRFLKEAGLLQ